jgi:hypothetical protein
MRPPQLDQRSAGVPRRSLVAAPTASTSQRLEGIAEPGGICISEDAFREVRGKVDAEFADIGEQSLRNIARPVRVYRLALQPAAEPLPAALPLPDKPSIAVLPFANMIGDPRAGIFRRRQRRVGQGPRAQAIGYLAKISATRFNAFSAAFSGATPSFAISTHSVGKTCSLCTWAYAGLNAQ